MRRGPPVRPMDRDAANAGSLSHSAKNARGGRACSSGSSLVVEACVGTRCGLSTPATMVGELAVDARQVALCRTQCFFAVEWSGELVGVAGQVGFFAGETILGCPELGAERPRGCLGVGRVQCRKQARGPRR